jgi:fatty acid desaturase
MASGSRPIAPPGSAAEGLPGPSDAAGLGRLAAQLALILAAAGGVVASAGTWLLLPAMALEGALLVTLFAPLHETAHRTAFRTRWLNAAVSRLCGFLLLIPAEEFRRFHLAHHRHTQDPARDPELAVPKPASTGAWLRHVSGLPLWASLLRNLLRRAAGRVTEPWVPAREGGSVVREARIHLALYLALGAGSAALASPALLLLWAGPVLLGQPWLRLFLLAEHAGCPLTRDMLANTRTTLTNGCVRFLFWNMPYHAEHHVLPGVPFHALPALHERLRPRLRVVAPGYVAVQREILAGFRRRA